MSITVISHVYNEEYLIPFWLEHHKHMFSHGIIIDYNSTDRTLDIVREICPVIQLVQIYQLDHLMLSKMINVR